MAVKRTDYSKKYILNTGCMLWFMLPLRNVCCVAAHLWLMHFLSIIFGLYTQVLWGFSLTLFFLNPLFSILLFWSLILRCTHWNKTSLKKINQIDNYLFMAPCNSAGMTGSVLEMCPLCLWCGQAGAWAPSTECPTEADLAKRKEYWKLRLAAHQRITGSWKKWEGCDGKATRLGRRPMQHTGLL